MDLKIKQISFRKHLHCKTIPKQLILSVKELIISLYHKDRSFFSQEASIEETVEHQEVLIVYPQTSSPLWPWVERVYSEDSLETHQMEHLFATRMQER